MNHVKEKTPPAATDEVNRRNERHLSMSRITALWILTGMALFAVASIINPIFNGLHLVGAVIALTAGITSLVKAGAQ